MESIINGMDAIKAALEYLSEATTGEARKVAADALDLAETIRGNLERMTATREETARLMAETVRATLQPVEE